MMQLSPVFNALILNLMRKNKHKNMKHHKGDSWSLGQHLNLELPNVGWKHYPLDCSM
jgi:hypothetical protein